MALLQWNCRGFRVHQEELRVLTSSLSPRIVALQETLLRPSDKPSFRGYEVLHRARVADRASGGVALLIAHDTCYEPVNLQTDLEILAIRVHTTQPLTVALVYLPLDNRLIAVVFWIYSPSCLALLYYLAILMPITLYGVARPPVLEVGSWRISFFKQT